MAKIFVVLTCLVGLCAGGVLDTRWMRNGRDERLSDGLGERFMEKETMGRLSRMTDSDLARQRILLELLDRVHETLDDMDLSNIQLEFVANERNYREGMDDDMLHVIELGRNGRLLGKRDVFTIVKEDHKRQMIGLKRLLSRAIDFETFVQNALTARNRMNAVLFVNALLLAVRERDDTRNLIVPAIEELLPELYLDRDTLRTIMNIDLNLVASRSAHNTNRPGLIDLLGLNAGRMGRNNRWGQMESLVPLNRKMLNKEDKIVIEELNKNRKVATMRLLTEDVGLKSFLHNLINDLCLKENELENGKTGRGTRARISGLAGLDDGIRYRDERFGIHGSQQLNDEINMDLPTTTIDDERLLHVNGKKWNRWNTNGQNGNMRNRFYDVMSINDGRRTQNNIDNTDLNRLSWNCINCIERQTTSDCNQCIRTTDDNLLDRLGHECKKCIQDMSEHDCDKCKVKININEIGSGRVRDVDINWNRRIVDGRRTANINDWNNNQVNRLNSKCIKCIERKTIEDCNKCERTTEDDVIDGLGNDCKKCIRDVNVYDCVKCGQRINLGTRNVDQVEDYNRMNNNNLRGRTVDDGRRTKYTNDVDALELNRLNSNCRQCIDRKTMRDCDMCKMTTDDYILERLDKDCRNCIEDVGDYECERCQTKIINDGINRNRVGNADDSTWKHGNLLGGNRRLMGNNLRVNVRDVMDRKKSTKSEVLVHNLKQVLSRINLERMSLGLGSIEDIMTQDSSIERMQNLGANDRLINTLNNKIMRKLENIKLNTGRLTDIDVDRVIAKALIERDGDVNILDILTDVIVQNIDENTDMQIVRDIGDALNDEKVLKTLRKIVKTVDRARTEILGTYKRDELELDDVEINDVVVDKLVTRTKDKDIDLRNLVGLENNVVVVRQPQLTHNNFNIRIDVDSKRSQRVVVRTLIGPKRIDDMGRDLSLNERRLGFMLLDTNVVDLDAGRNVIQLGSRDLIWAQRDTTTITDIYKRIMLGDRIGGSDVVIGQDCRFPQRLILPRGRVNGLDLELLVIITRHAGDINIRDDTTTKCAMGISVKGVDNKSMGFPLDRQIDDVHDLRALKNIVGVDIKIYHDDRKGLNWW